MLCGSIGVGYAAATNAQQDMLYSISSLKHIITKQYVSKQAQPHNGLEHLQYKEVDSINIDLVGDEFVRGSEHHPRNFQKLH